MTIIPNLFFVAVGSLMLLQIAIAPAGRQLQAGDPGPWVLPAFLAVLMILLGVIQILRDLIRRRSSEALSTRSQDAITSSQADMSDAGVTMLPSPNWRARIIFSGALLGYVALFTTLGFTLSTAAFLVIGISAFTGLRARALAVAALVAIVASLCLGWLLAGVVGVSLPGVMLLL